MLKAGGKIEKITKCTKVLIIFVILTYISQTYLFDKETKTLFRVMVSSNSSFSEIRNLVTSNTSGVGEITNESSCIYEISKHRGRISVSLTQEEIVSVDKELSKTVGEGGIYRPSSCKSKNRVAIIIPFRDREEHLKIFLRHMHPFLQRQKLEYGIYVIELDKNITFNRAILMNIGFVEAMKLHSYTCFVFHDVDLLPEDNGIPYSCANNPQHLSIAVDTLKYKLPKTTNFGGVSALKTEQYRKINGMSNIFFGWGGEDDDLSQRIRSQRYVIQRPAIDIGRYTMIGHLKDPSKNPQRFCLLNSSKQRMTKDGLTSLKYDRIKIEFRPLYTLVLVRVNETEIVKSDKFLYKFYTDCVKGEAKKANVLKANNQKKAIKKV